VKYIRKLTHYVRYLLGLLTQNPSLVVQEFLEDFKKDKQAINLKKNHNLVWICSLPKSGSTLVEDIISFYPYVKLDRSLTRFFSKGDLKHIHDISHELIESAPKNKLSFIKTHTHFSESIFNICNKYDLKVIFTFRDIRDVFISRYYHIVSDKSHRHHKIISSMPEKKGFISSFEKNHLNVKEPVLEYYYNWINNWQTKKDTINHLELWYEDYVHNNDFFLERIINFIGENKSSLLSLKNFLNQKKSRNKKKSLSKLINDKSKGVSTFRSGKINNWKIFFDEEITKKFNESLPGPLDLVLKK